MSLRTMLFVPGDRPDRFQAAAASGADAIVFDLEDAVTDANKPTARTSVARWLGDTPRAGDQLRLVRVNARASSWRADDDVLVHALVTDKQIDGIVIPKCEQASDLHELPATGYWPIIESARGLVNVNDIASASGVQQLIFGSIDLQLDLGMNADADETELASYRAQVVLASRLAGLCGPADGVTVAWTDDDAITRATQRAMRQGFATKLCIHPRQVPVVHDAMRPTDDEIARARRIIEAAESVSNGALAVDGMMVDRPVVNRARALMERAVTKP
ncbi:MAG: CoA ester lyase [Gemmatimonadaceae bacterium]